MGEEEAGKFLKKIEKKYLDTLASHRTIRDAALALGISPRTLYNWCFNLRRRYIERRGWLNTVINYRRKSLLIARILSKRKPLEGIEEEELV
ncbi:MAG: hypothetical protein NZ932_03825 [Candidatus Bathyarchaeota archaeon]|nr:hypothetical protein [Candidatus Bathyarchaeota archaeon]MDW8022403.1 hypothetical protein [Nitrososphaerota archaeon]